MVCQQPSFFEKQNAVNMVKLLQSYFNTKPPLAHSSVIQQPTTQQKSYMNHMSVQSDFFFLPPLNCCNTVRCFELRPGASQLIESHDRIKLEPVLQRQKLSWNSQKNFMISQPYNPISNFLYITMCDHIWQSTLNGN